MSILINHDRICMPMTGHAGIFTLGMMTVLILSIFANPSGQRYAPEETKDAWEKTILFLDSTLKE